MLSLAKQGILRNEHLESAPKLGELVFPNIKRGIQKMQWGIAIDQEFIKEAIIAWKKGKKLVAIVLYAAAVEQYINQTYGHMLRAHGLENGEIEKIVRTLNIEPKLSWLLRLVTKKEFPKALGKRLRAVFELRNAIVHFKGIPGHPDKDEDSHSRIETELGKLKRLSLSRDYRLLQESLWEIALEKDPDLDLALKASDLILSHKGKRTK